MDNGFSSPRRDVFPAGLRVLVVDDDPTWLRILEKMLKKCSYEVTTCCLAREALNLLRERKDGYDIVISDVNMPDMDGFKLLEHVGLEMDLPVIMMSVDGETSRVMKGVQHGACDYLLKPIRMKELRNIWQHVFRKRIHEAREFESHEGFEGIHLMRNGLDHSDDGSLFSLEDMTSTRKRKDADSKHDDKDFGDSSTTKKARVVWSVDLHQQFVKAVNQIGFDKAGPKKILDLMNVPWLTRENVASHLQKYRLYLTRLQKENEQKSSTGGMKLSDLPSKDPTASFSFQNSVNGLQSDVAVDSYKYSVGTFPQNLNDSSHQGDVKGTVLEPGTEKRTPNNIPDSQIRRSSRMSNNQIFPPLESESNHAIYDRTIPTEYSRSKVPGIQHKQENKSLLQVDDSFSQLPLHGIQPHVQVDQSKSVASINSNFSVAEREVSGCVETKPLFTGLKNKYGSSVNSVERAVDTFSIQSSNDLVNDQSLEAISTSNLGMKTLAFNTSSMSGLEFHQRNPPLGDEPGSAPLNEDVQLGWLSGECYNMAFGLQNIEIPEYYVPGLITEVPLHFYDSADYSVVDQGLYIA